MTAVVAGKGPLPGRIGLPPPLPEEVTGQADERKHRRARMIKPAREEDRRAGCVLISSFLPDLHDGVLRTTDHTGYAQAATLAASAVRPVTR
jgi:hypothetical protein